MIDQKTGLYADVSIQFKIQNTGLNDTNKNLVNSPFIFNNIPIGVITDITDDWISGYLFSRYLGFEANKEYNTYQGITINTEI